MSGKLAPSKTTVYVGNLPFSLTNNDLSKIFAKYGTVVKVTVLKDRVTRRSKGVAFILFLEREAAHKCVHALDAQTMFGRKLKVRMAEDNGRAAEFIRRRDYPDKTRCYECGEPGHLSYTCPRNLLGDRPPPEKKKKKVKEKKKKKESRKQESTDDEEEEEGEDPALDSWTSAVAMASAMAANDAGESGTVQRRRYRASGLFSDEEEEEEEEGDGISNP